MFYVNGESQMANFSTEIMKLYGEACCSVKCDVWCVVVQNGVLWYGMVYCGMEWCVVAWHRMLWYGVCVVK